MTNSSSLNPAYLGIDLGGSNSLAVAFNSNLEVITQDKIATKANNGYLELMNRIRKQCHRIERIIMEKGFILQGVGLAVPGIVTHDGLVPIAPNLGWKNVRPLDDLKWKSDLELQFKLLNDVNAGLLGELTKLNKKNYCTVSFFCGTGIGGAVAYQGGLVLGSDGGAGEVGHMVVIRGGRKCGCGSKGCLEAYIGKWALNQKIVKYMKTGKETLLKKIIDYDLRELPVKSSSLKKAYKKGDPFTLYLMQDYYASYLAVGISQAVNFLNPNLILLGGGIMESMGKKLLPFILEKLRKHCLNSIPELRLAVLKDLAGPTGAAASVKLETKII